MDLLGTKVIHIEPTSLCNAECPQCARNINGSGLNPNINLGSLDLDWFQKHLDNTALKDIEKIFFCGNMGDPCATPQLIEIITYLKQTKPSLVIGVNTNASLRTAEWFTRLGTLLQGRYDYVVFSIDGLEDTNHIYRKRTQWKKIMDNARAFIDTGASAHWDMLVFKHNQHQVETALKLAKHMGFRWFRTKVTDRWDMYPVSEQLSPPFTHKQIDYSNTEPDCERDRDISVFLDYTGKLWPCCHMAEAYFSEIGKNLHTDIREFSNQQLMTEYKHRLTTDPFYVCKRSCGTETGKSRQWKKEYELSSWQG
jgi:MoaA/NifB/PqqE/SkfB family radical SAM enzyme